MNWIEMIVHTTTPGADWVSDCLVEHGANGTMIEDKADIPDPSKPHGYWEIVDPALPDSMPEDVLVHAWFVPGISFRDTLSVLQSVFSGVLSSRSDFGSLLIETRTVSDNSWSEVWKKYYKPFYACSHLVIKPTWEPFEAAPDDRIIEIDPGMAFGSGTHETTGMCISLLEETIHGGERVIDLGTGSGILAIAAALFGAGHVLAVDIDEVIAYFAVHNFVVSWNSYTGDTAGNYFLYEKRGHLSMLPWDYSSAFGTYRSGDATKMINYPVDTPLLKGLSGSRPMFDWIMKDQRYVTAYHAAMRDLIDRYSGENDISFELKQIEAMLTPYIEKDQNKFASETAFHKGVDTLISFWKLRSESVENQLSGIIPSTLEGQAESPELLIDADSLELIDMK